MFKLNKMLACALSLSLLGQSTLFAAPAKQPSQQPKTLVEYQQRARAEVKRSPWIQREGKYILGIGGALTAGFILQGVHYQRKIRKMEQKYISEINKTHEYYGSALARQSQRRGKGGALSGSYLDDLEQITRQLRQEMLADKNKIAFLEKQIAQLEHANKMLRKDHVYLSKKAEGLHKASEIRQGRVQALKEELAQLQKRYELSETRYTFLSATNSAQWSKQLDSYVKIFDASVPETERLALRKQLAKEPWLLQATQLQQKEFLKIIDHVSEVSVHASTTSADPYMHSMIRMFVDKELPLYDRLISLCRRAFHSKNLMAVGLIVALGASAQSASAQRMADRINRNFDLFLNASARELAVMEKDKEVVKVCVQGAEVLHQMSQLTKEEQALLSKEWKVNNTRKFTRASRVQLAR